MISLSFPTPFTKVLVLILLDVKPPACLEVEACADLSLLHPWPVVLGLPDHRVWCTAPALTQHSHKQTVTKGLNVIK